MDKPVVSIITPVFNAEIYLDECINSVLNQTYSEWEMILVNDCSTDQSNAIIQNFATSDPRIKIISFDQNCGAAIARNTAIEAANGKYIAFLDADDYWKKEKLEMQVKFMQANKYAFTFTYYEWINQNAVSKKIIKAKSSVSYRQLLKSNTIGCLTAMYDAEILGKKYMPNIRKRQDYGLWLDILKSGEIAYCLPEVLAVYRARSHSLSGNKRNVLRYNWTLLRKHQGLSVFTSLYYFSCFLFNKSIKYFKAMIVSQR